MPKYYIRNCDKCGNKYEGRGAKYCSTKCQNEGMKKETKDPKPVDPQIVDITVYRKKLQSAVARHNQEKSKFVATIEALRNELAAATYAKDSESYSIPVHPSTSSSESTAVTLWSDWHLEEEVEPRTVNNLNKFNLEIGEKRVAHLANRVVKFIRMYRRDTEIKTLIIGLLGDFITNNIHDEFMEICLLRPMDAMIHAQNLIIRAIEFILEHTDLKLEIFGLPGNHSRTTKKVHIATEAGNSLEYWMYDNLAQYFSDNPRVNFQKCASAHFYLECYGLNIRSAHGHQIRYYGGVGGLLIPLRRKVAEWDKAIKADLNFFGHFHNEQKFGKIIVNGSLIGFSKYALDGGFEYEPPKQNLFLINRQKKQVTIYSPILL